MSGKHPIEMNDQELIEYAESLHYIDWYEVDKLKIHAKTKDTVKKLSRICVKMYRKEQAFGGPY